MISEVDVPTRPHSPGPGPTRRPPPAGLDPDHLLPRRDMSLRRVELPAAIRHEALDPLDLTDAGLLYFWIREQDARRRDFDKVWLILQCG